MTFVDAEGCDTMIPFYMMDCDMHARLWMRGLTIKGAFAGKGVGCCPDTRRLEGVVSKGGC